MALSITKVQPQRIFQDVVDQLQAAILAGDLAPGDALPSELKLKELFATGRGTIREALRVLEQKGLIEIRQGAAGGAIVRQPDPSALSSSLDLLLRHQRVAMDELAEFRQDLEARVTELVARRASERDIDGLAAILDEARELARGGVPNWHAFLDADQRFHVELARLTGNAVYLAVVEATHLTLLPDYERFQVQDDSLMLENLDDLNRVLRALRRRDGAEASRAMQAHIARFNRHMIEHDKTPSRNAPTP